MTERHPLTNEMCHELSCWPLEELDDFYVEGTITDMRAAYDLAIEHVHEIWDRLFAGAEKDSIVWLAFNRELEEMRPQQQQQEEPMTKEITMEEVKNLVEFRYSPVTESWRVAKVQGNSSMDVMGDCWSVEGTVVYTINGKSWEFAETPRQKLARLIKERAPHSKLLEVLSQMDDSK